MSAAGFEGGTTRDAFLGGRLQIDQPRRGYRAGVDPVLLAAACPAQPGQSLLELGCGAGVAALCVGARVPGLRLTGIELQDSYAQLARGNARANALPLEVVTADLRDLPAAIKAQSFDHVILNPPYFERARSSPSEDPGRDIAFGGDTPLECWIDTAARRLAPKGWLTVIQRPERLPELLGAVSGRLGSVCLRPLAPRAGRDAALILLAARKGGRALPRLLAPWVLHEGAAHGADGEDYTPQTRAVLRDGAALPMG